MASLHTLNQNIICIQFYITEYTNIELKGSLPLLYPGASFDEIVALYQFDSSLRELILKYLLQIERHIGNLIAYYFIEKHGISQTEYTNPDNYNNIPQNQKTINGFSLSKMYNVLPQSLRSKICRHFPPINQRQLERFLSVSLLFIKPHCRPYRRNRPGAAFVSILCTFSKRTSF